MRLIPITKLVNHEVAYLIKELWEAIDNTNNRLDTLADDNQQLMAQISAKAEQPKPLQARIAELENRIKNAIDSINATENVIKCARVDTYKALERIKYILTAPPEEVSND